MYLIIIKDKSKLVDMFYYALFCIHYFFQWKQKYIYNRLEPDRSSDISQKSHKVTVRRLECVKEPPTNN